MKVDRPKDRLTISIVTASYNAANTLADTLKSVSLQSYPSVEHVVMDGGSRDATSDVVQLHGQHLSRFVSEEDRGIYDAMNKGFILTRGEIVGFLNADDWYAGPDVLNRVAEAFGKGADVVYGDLAFVSPMPPFEVRRMWLDAPHKPVDFFRSGWQPAHPATFVRRSLFEALGGFDLRWRIGADYCFMARAMRHPEVRLRHVPQILVNMRLGGVSTTGLRAIWHANRECAQGLRDAGQCFPWWTIAMKLGRKIPQVLSVVGAPVHAPVWRPNPGN